MSPWKLPSLLLLLYLVVSKLNIVLISFKNKINLYDYYLKLCIVCIIINNPCIFNYNYRVNNIFHICNAHVIEYI